MKAPLVESEDQTRHLTVHVDDLCRRARPAARRVALAADAQRQAALEAVARRLEAGATAIETANRQDLAAAEAAGLSAAMRDRLGLHGKRLLGTIADLRAVAAQADPVGRVLEERTISQGLHLRKIAVPIGVVAIIFESRPNVTVDCAALCVRSGNACILRGGKEAAATNRVLAELFRAGLEDAGLPADAVQLVAEADRALIPLLLARDDALDLVVPRGGEALIRQVVAVSRVPVVKHDKGVCNLYVHAQADLEMALTIADNAKRQRPATCNAIEKILVDAAIAPAFLPRLAHRLPDVQLRADAQALPFLPTAQAATAADWDAEYLDLILAVRVVSGLEEAIALIERHGSHHSDAIVTADPTAAARFLAEVDSACVYHNASTRFTDGGQFGMGAEVGISTNRVHARGPMGIAELCTYKYVVCGQGQVRR